MTKSQYKTFMANMAERFAHKAINAADAKNPEAATAYFKLAKAAGQEALMVRK